MRVKNVKEAFLKVKTSPLIWNEKKVIIHPDINLEIGAGKGKFIIEKALQNPTKLFVALEKYSSICYRILEKQQQLLLPNLVIINDEARFIFDYFMENSVSTIYLNFSDPWPRRRDHKKRLTAPFYLELYEQILKMGGKLYLRTDHFNFFRDSLKYFKNIFFIIKEVLYEAPELTIMSEYELLKRNNGKKIYQLIVQK